MWISNKPKVSEMQAEDSFLRKRGYTIGNKLGSGSYATVKSAMWRKPGTQSLKQVALKIINMINVPKDFKDKFLPRELEVVKILDHDNVIKTLEIFNGERKTYLSLEYASHGDLLQYVRTRGALAESICAPMFKEIVQGLNYLHSRQVVHRDLKCENILLNQNNTAKIADFGFARRMSSKDLSKTYCGSMAYAAPEILEGTPYQGTRSDIWSIGVILFIMLNALMPFRDESYGRLCSDQKKPLRYPSTISVSIHAKMLVEHLLQWDCMKRPKAIEILDNDWVKTTKKEEVKIV